MADKSQSLRVVPALRGIFGSWVYYSALLSLDDVANHIKVAEEIHSNKKLSEMIQRELTKKRAKEIADYLRTQSERFLNSLVVAVYGGQPKWHALGEIRPDSDLDTSKIDEETLASVGFLTLSGDETFFALDGQHRLAGIRKAIKSDETLCEDEINVIFVAHQETTEGRQRTRRLFTTLNKRAKPVAKGAIIALDEDDTMAIMCRRLVEEHSCFKGNRIAYQATNNMPPTNQTAFTTIGALYDVLTALFCGVHQAKRETLKYYRPPDDELNDWHGKALAFFDLLNKYFPAYQEFCEAGEKYPKITKKFRHPNGGSVLFRPIGLVILVEAIEKMRKYHKKPKIEKLMRHLARINWTLTELPFNDILWDSAGKRMETGAKVLCRDLVLYVAGQDEIENALVKSYYKKKGVSREDSLSFIRSLDRLEKFDG